MFESIQLESILFLDIETVPSHPDFESMPEVMREHWVRKTETLRVNTSPEEHYERAGIYAEFGKIVCVSLGYFKLTQGVRQFRIKSCFGEDEKEILTGFLEIVEKHFNRKDSTLCGHNSREFDFPYLSRRMLINGIRLPAILNIAGKKPWEVNLLDTMDLWKFGDYKSYTSLNLLASVFDIATPKDDISGKDVCNVFWKEKDCRRIARYCQKDVLTVAQLLLRFRGEKLLQEDEIFIAEGYDRQPA
jgi:3'-5' exonuclease